MTSKRIALTGGYGFIGSALIRLLLRETDYEVLNVHKLTYAANLASIPEYERENMLVRWNTALGCDPSMHPYWWPAALPFDLLAPAGLDRIREHIQLTGSRHPWKPIDPAH